MAKAPTLTDISSGYASTTTLNANNTAIESSFENTISRDGSTPNDMEADLDLGSNDLLNGGYIYGTRLYLNGSRVVSTESTLDWEGDWVTSTAYVVDDMAKDSGNVYICLEDHTSGTFSTDLAAAKWELFVSKGDTGSGSGDLVAANNLSDVGNADTVLANIGGTTQGIANFKSATGITGTLVTLDNGGTDWTFEVVSNNLIIKYNGTSTAKLDTSGNLTVIGDVTAYGTI